MTTAAQRLALRRSFAAVPEYRDSGDIPARAETNNTCQHCRWAQEGKRPGSFKCRRLPPTVHQARPGECLFPIVEADDWCGEFSQ